jgi:hypothetical protein
MDSSEQVMLHFTIVHGSMNILSILLQQYPIWLCGIAKSNKSITCFQAEWEFYNMLLGVKVQVVAQYSKDSDQVQALALKKESKSRNSGGNCTGA